MKSLMFFAVFLISFSSIAQGYLVGDKARDFRLKNIDGKMLSLSDFPDAKGFILMFSCNHCPYSVLYEDRKIELDKKFKPLGFPVVIINPNDPEIEPRDSYENMIIRAKEKGFTFPYVVDETQEIARTYGATRTPHVYILVRQGNDLIVKYIGAIDNNSRNADAVTVSYVEDAIGALLEGNDPDPSFTRAIGCTIKWRAE